MNNSVFDLNQTFDFSILNLGNPTLANNNNYISKISHGMTSKNLYIQLPKCTTKQGIIKSSSKIYTELNFSISQKNVIDFLENLEKFCTEKIYSNRELWFYESSNIEKTDIDELMLSTMKPYKHGKNFLLKTYIKTDKLNIYDENENKISIDDFDNTHEFIPLVNINNIKFSTKNFSIEIFLTQMMVLLPSDEFEKQLLIKTEQPKHLVKSTSITSSESIKEVLNNHESPNNITLNTIESNTENTASAIENTASSIENAESNTENAESNTENAASNTEHAESNTEHAESSENTNSLTSVVLPDSNKIIKSDENTSCLVKEAESSKNDDFKYLTNNVDLETVNILDIPETKEYKIDLKSHEEIYLEIYKTAKEKAKEIRKNAITAFLEAKKIKIKYNLDNLDIESSDDDEDFLKFDS